MDPDVAARRLPTRVVKDEDKFNEPFREGEDRFGLVGLFVCWNKPHVLLRDPDEGRHVVMAANCGGVPRCVVPDWEDQDH